MLTSDSLKGVFVPVITPFQSNGELDLPSYRNYLLQLLRDGIHGIVVGGTTGESPTLSWEEVEKVYELTRSTMTETNVSLPIILGTGTNDTASTLQRTIQARELGSDAVLVVVPYYNRPSITGIVEHYRQAAQAGISVIAYNIPYRTGVTLSTENLKQIMEIPGVIGLKDSSGGIKQLIELAQSTNKPILCGEDFYFYAALCCGAQGGILASSSIQTNHFKQVYEWIQEGRWTEAKGLFDSLLPLIELLYREPNPAPIKWLLEHQGVINSGALRLPMTPITEELQAELALLRL